MRVRTLSSILGELDVGAIDFLEIDVEGLEPSVLRGLDLDRYRPTVVVVEASRADQCAEVLLPRRYRLEFFDGLNLYHVDNDATDVSIHNYAGRVLHCGFHTDAEVQLVDRLNRLEDRGSDDARLDDARLGEGEASVALGGSEVDHSMGRLGPTTSGALPIRVVGASTPLENDMKQVGGANSEHGGLWSDDPPFVSYAQNWEDVVLWRALQGVESGTYVDVGAADPVLDSVTKAFYDRGWSGVNVEPVAEYHAALEAARPRDVNVRAGAATSAGQLTLHRFEGTGLSTFVSEVAEGALASRAGDEVIVEVQRLDEILRASLDRASDIHFLKIDVEGFERDVLAGVDLSVWRPWIIVVEATEPSSRTPTHHRWEHLLIDANYQFALFDGLNRFYVAAEREQLFSAVSYPVCVFDAPYRSAAHARDVEALDLANRRWMEAAEELVAKQQMLDAAVRELQVKQQLLEELTDARIVDRDALASQAAALEVKQAMLEQLVEALEEKQAMLEHLVEALNAERSELDRLRTSRSWKVTRPLRAVSGRLSGSRD